MRVACTVIVLLLLATGAYAQGKGEKTIKLGVNAKGFHISKKYNGATIRIRPPDNEHRWMSIQDLMTVFTDSEDIEIWETDHIKNAYAIISGKGTEARRLIVFDDKWMTHREDQVEYAIVLAHELGHHACGHTAEAFIGSPFEMELEADRAAGAILRRVTDEMNGRVANATITYKNALASARAYFGRAKLPFRLTGELRVKAFVRGWEDGSQCLNNYKPLNPPKKLSYLESHNLAFGSDLWWYGGSILKTEVDSNTVRLIMERPNWRALRAGALHGKTIFAGTLVEGGRMLKGILWVYSSHCHTPFQVDIKEVPVQAGSFKAVGEFPLFSNCRIILKYAHFIRLDNTGLHSADGEGDPRPFDAKSFMDEAAFDKNRGDVERSVADLTKSIELDPSNATAYNLRAQFLSAAGRWSEALPDAHRAVSLNPAFAGAFYTRGSIFEVLGSLDAAVADYRRALALQPDLEGIAKALKRLGAER